MGANSVDQTRENTDVGLVANKNEHAEGAELVGTGPLLLGLQLSNQNNNNNGTIIVRRSVAEVTYLHRDQGDRDRKRAASEVLQHGIEKGWEANMVDTALLHGLQLANQVNSTRAISNNPNITKILAARREVSEVNSLRPKLDEPYEPGKLSLNDARAGSTMNNSGQVFKSYIPTLSKSQVEVFNTNGYLVIPGVLTASECGALHDEAQKVIQNVMEGGKGITMQGGSGVEQMLPIGRVLATFETGIPSRGQPSAVRDVARLGCGVHQLMHGFHLLTHRPFHRAIWRSIGCSANPRISQSQVIVKNAGHGEEVSLHQDGCVSFTDPPSCLTYWYALEDSTIDNGCLEVAKGSHLTHPIRQRFVKGAKGQVQVLDLDEPLWAKRSKREEKEKYEYERLEVAKGTLVLFHGNLLHRSSRNRSEKGRMAYAFSAVDGDAHMPDDSYLKPDEGELDCL